VLQNKYLPAPHFSEIHRIAIQQPPDKVWPLVERLDFSGSKVIRFLFALRGMPAQMMNLDSLEKGGFKLLEAQQHELIIGLVGQFWKPSGNLQSFTPIEFVNYVKPGFTKATWSFTLSANKEISTLETETRIFCTDDHSRRLFKRYWFFIRPFSGLIRMEILKGIRTKSERQ